MTPKARELHCFTESFETWFLESLDRYISIQSFLFRAQTLQRKVNTHEQKSPHASLASRVLSACNFSQTIHVWSMVYLPTFTIKINYSCIGKYTIVPWMLRVRFLHHQLSVLQPASANAQTTGKQWIFCSQNLKILMFQPAKRHTITYINGNYIRCSIGFW